MGINPRAHKLLRSYMIEAAWVAVRQDPVLQAPVRQSPDACRGRRRILPFALRKEPEAYYCQSCTQIAQQDTQRRQERAAV
jgi:hypothetical protein